LAKVSILILGFDHPLNGKGSGEELGLQPY
jgi:hypothetical protein